MGPWAIALAVGLFGSFMTTVLVGGIMHSFTRETTGVNERWLGRTMAERDALTNQLAALNVFANISDNSDEAPSDPNGDFDGDGIPNGREDGSLIFNGADDPGTEAKNPDTDGDGVTDGKETERGTDPTNGEDGGLTSPPVYSETSSGRTVLVIDQVIKTVGGEHYIETTPGSTITFQIQVDVTKYGTGPKYLEIVDRLPSGSQFESGRINSTFGNVTLQSWPGSKRYLLSRAGRYTFDIQLTVKITGTGSMENVVSVYDTTFPNNSVEDAVYILSEFGNIGGGASEDITYVGKEGKKSSSRTWTKHVFATSGDNLNFRLTALTGELDFSDRATLQDTLPQQLSYLPGTAKLSINGQDQNIDPNGLASQLFGDGYPLTSSGSAYEIIFSAKLEASPSFDITNYLNGFVGGFSRRQSYVRITPRP